MKSVFSELFDVMESDNYVMTVVPEMGSFPFVHCLFVNEDKEASWCFPETDMEPDKYVVDLDLLLTDLQRGDLIPIHIAPQYVN